MARQVLPIVGAVVGAYFGNPQLGFAIGSIIGNVVDPQVIKGPSIGEGQTTTTQEGQPRPIVWGAGVVGANIIDRGELKKTTKRQKQSKGGPVQETEHFHITYAIRICEGPIIGIVRIWEDEKLVYDIRPDGTSQMSAEDNSNFAKQFRLYLGDEEQMPDSALEAIHGVGNTPAYRGTAYIVFENKDVTQRGGSIPTYRFEVLAGGGEVKQQGQFFFPQQYRGVETDDGWNMIEQIPPVGRNNHKQYVITNDGKFMLVSGSELHTSNGAQLYKIDNDTQQFAFYGYFSDIVAGYPEFTGTSYASYFDISAEGSTIVIGRDGAGAFGTPMLSVIKYNATTEQFYHTDSFYIDGSVGVPIPTVDPTGTWFVTPRTSGPGGINKFFLTTSGTLIAQKQIATPGIYNPGNMFLVIPSGEKAFVSSVFGLEPSSKQLAYIFTGVTPEMNAEVYVRNFDSDFPGHVFENQSGNNNIIPYYSESSSGGGKFLLFANNYTTTPYKFIIASYEVISGIPMPGLPALVPKLEYQSPEGWGWVGSSTGGYQRDITAVGSSAAPSIFGTTLMVYKFVHDYSSGNITLEKRQGYDAPINSAIRYVWYYQVIVSQSKANTGDGISYKWFVDDVCNRSDIPASKLNTEEMAEYTIRGVVAAQQYTAAEVIRATQPVFPVDVADYDRQIHFTKRGKPAVAAITIDQIVDGTYDTTRQEAISYPRKLNLIYQHQRTGYIAAKATVERISPDVRVSGETTTQVPVVMDEHQAAKAADILLKTTWTDLEGEVEFSVPTSFDYLTVGDCVAIYPRSGQQFRMRIDTIQRADGRLDIKGKIDRQSSYGSQATGLPIPDPTPPPPTTVGPTRLAYLDIPALTDADDALVYYVAVNGETEAWSGAQTQRRIVPDDFEEVASSGRGQCVGSLDAALGTGPEHYADTFNSVYVYFPGGEMNAPQSVTDDQLLREQNVLAISRPDGSAELVQFRDVEDLGDGHYKLSYLLRGRLYTGVSTHSVGTTVTLLDYGVSRITVDAALLDSTWQHRAVSFGESPETAPIRTDTFAARSQIEFPPGLLAAERNGSDLLVSWSHAFRFGSDVHPVDSVNRTGYYLEVSDGSGTVISTLAASAETATVDISSLSGPLTVSIRGINRYTGEGLPSTIQID